jgi:predicted MPP superfamily phosphohydrolase
VQLLVLHLSDGHFRETGNFIADRSPNIAAAVSSSSGNIDAVLVAFSGDVAYSGRSQEYKAAGLFCGKLRDALKALGVPVQFVFVPGNHDCNFSKSSDVRQTLKEVAIERLVKIDPAGDMAKHCLSVQQEFFDFVADFNGYPVPGLADQIAFDQDLTLGKHSIRIYSYNTAWFSQLPEQQSRLCIPKASLDAKYSSAPADLAISVFHHSYPWLEATNGRSFRVHIEQHSDLVLTGHDHVSDSYSKRNLQGAIARYTEGALLQGSDPHDSGFHVMLLDTEGKREKVYRYTWNGELYARVDEPEWIAFLRNPALAKGHFYNNERFTAFLSDVGSGFSHRHKKDIRLDDLYVYPDLKIYPVKPQTELQASGFIKGDAIIEFLEKNPKTVIIGSERSGKTSLAKTLYAALHMMKGRVPVLLLGHEIRTAGSDNVQSLIENKFASQYTPDLLERFRQLDKPTRVLIIDDFDKIKLNRRGQKSLIDIAKNSFGTIVVFADDLFRLQELTGSLDADHPFYDFEQCQIQDFGYALRGELIEKWLALGRELTIPQDQLSREVSSAEHLVTTVIGKNLLPSSPITVLTMLQAYEAGQQQNTISGSYGYIYEVLITAALSLVSSKGADIDTKYTFLALLAHHLFATEHDTLSSDDLNALQESYFSRYRIRLNLDKILSELVECRLLQDLNGLFQFRYKYAYYYFVARYLKDNLDEETLPVRTALDEMADKIYYEEFANVLMFFVYLTRDRLVIERLLSNAQSIYEEHPPCDFKSHVAFINTLSLPQPDVATVALSSHDEHRRQHRQQLDLDAESDAAEQDSNIQSRRIAYDRELDDVIKLNIALKTLEILGQVLRNFPGSLRAELKAKLAKESYLLGLRTIRALLATAEINIDDLRTYFATVIKERRVVRASSERDLAEDADGLLIWTSIGCAYSIIKRISGAVGLQELNETYREVLEQSSDRQSFALIDCAIKLDHFREFPDSEVHELSQYFHKNYFTFRMLRQFIIDHMYLFPVDYRTRQRIGDLLNIKVSHPLLIQNPHKRLKGDS